MPVRDDPAGGRAARILTDAAGRPLARFVWIARGEPDYADVFAPEPGVELDALVPAIMAELRGVRVCGPLELGRVLVAAGATPQRHAHVMRHDLRDVPAVAVPAGLRVGGLDRDVADLVPGSMAAYHPGHLDHEPGDDDPARVQARLDALLSGAVLGPLLSCSRLATTEPGEIAAAAIVTYAPEPERGPWLAELWRVPGHARGAGAAVLGAAMRAAAADGHDSLGLVVTEGNRPARALYDRFGFRVVLESYNVDVP